MQTFNDSTEPQAVCVGTGPPRLCSTGNLPAYTWFDAMTLNEPFVSGTIAATRSSVPNPCERTACRPPPG